MTQASKPAVDSGVRCTDCGKQFADRKRVTAIDIWQAHSSMTGHRGPTDAAPRVVTECWTCSFRRNRGTPIAANKADEHRAAGHDVRPVRDEGGK